MCCGIQAVFSFLTSWGWHTPRDKVYSHWKEDSPFLSMLRSIYTSAFLLNEIHGIVQVNFKIEAGQKPQNMMSGGKEGHKGCCHFFEHTVI